MLKRISLMTIIVLLLNLLLLPPVLAADKRSKEAKHAAKVKAGIAKLGTGKEARIKVKLKDGTKLKGYVSEIGDDSFTVTDPETATNTEVPYPNAKQVQGNNFSRHAVIAIGLVVFITVMLIIYNGQEG